MKALKAVVIFMAVLIVAGLGLLAYGLVTKIGGVPDKEADNGQNEARQYSAFGTVETALPPGGRVAGMTVNDGRVVVRVEAPDGDQLLMVFNVDTGAFLGTIRIKAAK